MERVVWRGMMAALRGLPRTRTVHQLYSDSDILAVLLWAALHDRSINWACQRGNWPVQAWRRRLPDQSTVSRRLRSPSLQRTLLMLAAVSVREHDDQSPAPAGLAMLDGKPLELSNYTTDALARTGRGAGRYAKGYKLHTLIDTDGRVLAAQVTPLNAAECVVAVRLLRRAVRAGLLAPGAVVLADAAYDSNPLYRRARRLGLHLLVPRKRPGTGLGKRLHEPGRLLSMRITETRPDLFEPLRCRRSDIERYFGALASVGGGLHALPPWVRGRRVSVWVLAKLALNAAESAIDLPPEAALLHNPPLGGGKRHAEVR